MKHFYLKFMQKFLLLSFFLAVNVSAESINIAGSTTLYPVIKQTVPAYQKNNPDVAIIIDSVGSGVGLRKLIDEQIDIAVSSRFATEQELKDAASKDIYLVPFRMAYDYVLPVVHPKNPVKDLSLEEMGKIYTGEINNWRQVGGDDQPILVVSREKTSGTFSLWSEKVLGNQDIVASVKTINSNAEMVAAVSRHKNAIGYISRGYLNIYLKPLSIAGSYATLEKAINEQYPLSRTLFMFTRGWPAGETLKYINYVICSQTGRKIIGQSGLIPIGEFDR